MHESTRHNYRLITIFISTLAAGIPLWTTSSKQIDFSEIDFLLLWVGIGILASFIARFVANLKMRDMVGCFAIGYVIATVVHFVSSILLNSYVQAQFELSLLVALLAGIVSGSLGSLLWMGIKRSGSKKK